MTPEFWAIMGVGVAIGGLFWRMDVRIGRLDERMASLGGRMAKLEGAMDGFTKGFSAGGEIGVVARHEADDYAEWKRFRHSAGRGSTGGVQ